MRGRTGGMAAAALTALALFATACGGGGTAPQPGSEASGEAGGEIMVYGCTPKNALVPGNTNEACGGYMVVPIDCQADPLRHRERHHRSTTSPSPSRLRTTSSSPSSSSRTSSTTAPRSRPRTSSTPGTTPRTDPTVRPTATSLGRSPATRTPNAPDADCKQTPKAKTLAGLKVVDDKTFTIQTSEQVSNLPVRLGYNAFAPLPDSFFADSKAYEAKPIGAGPFKLESKTNTEIVLAKFADYGGKSPSPPWTR